MHPLKGRKWTKQHCERISAALKGRKRAEGAGRPANTPEILWSKVDKRGPMECWPWLGFKNVQGYGRTWIGDHGYYAHRVIFDLANPGLISREAPKNRKGFGVIRHSCDNPECCNPAHLTIGTQKDNVSDMHARGRAPDFRGRKNPYWTSRK